MARHGARFYLQVEIFGEAFDQAEPFREGGAAFEPDVEALVMQCPKRVRDPVVLLHERHSEASVPGHNLEQVVEFQVLMNEAHGAAATVRCTAPRTSACVRREP